MKKNYIIVGDSIAYGIGDIKDGGWSTMLKKYAISKPYNPDDVMRVHVAAFPGITSIELEPKIEDIIKAYYDYEMLNTVIVAVGINDSRVGDFSSKVSIEEYEKSITKIIDKIKNNNCNSLFVGLTNISGNNGILAFENNKKYINDVIVKYDKVLEKVCRDNDCKYVKTFGILNYEDLDDGLHPTNSGHKKIYEKVLNEVR